MSAVSVVRRRLAGDFEVDEWGFDADAVAAFSSVFGLRWSIEVSGAALLAQSGPALLVYNRRFGSSEPFVAARAVRLETGRQVRVAGAPDLPVVGPVLRRLGAVLHQPDEIASVLRAGHVVAVGLGRTPSHRSAAGVVDVGSIAEARRLGAPVHPVGLIGHEHRRHWRVAIGADMGSDWNGREPDDPDVAEAVRTAVAGLIGAGRAGK